MAKSIYSDEVWDSIKLIWEGTPKISWAEVLRQVEDALRCEVPSQQACINRKEKEQWKKSRLKKDLKSDLKIKQKNQVTKVDENQLKTMDYNQFINHQIQQKILEKNEPLTKDDLADVIKKGTTTQMQVILDHRNKGDVIAQLENTLLDKAKSAFETDLIDLEDDEFEEKSRRHYKLVSLIEKEVSIFNMLVAGSKQSQDMRFKAWGITEVTNEDAEKARQQDVQKLDEDLAKEREEVKEQQQRLFVERTRLIESGAFEVRPVEPDFIEVRDDE